MVTITEEHGKQDNVRPSNSVYPHDHGGKSKTETRVRTA